MLNVEKDFAEKCWRSSKGLIAKLLLRVQLTFAESKKKKVYEKNVAKTTETIQI